MMTFAQLYETYFNDIYRFAVWLSRDATEADDLASETFVRAWTQRHRLRTETLKAREALCVELAITRSVFLAQRRRARVQRELPDGLLDDSPDPQRRAVARFDLQIVHNGIARLPKKDRVALGLRADQSLPYAEIARILEISEGAARVKVYRARRKLLDFYLNHKKEMNHGTDS